MVLPRVLIADMDEALHNRLKSLAASHQRSIEDEAKELLSSAVARLEPGKREHIVDAAERLFGKSHGFDLELPGRNCETERTPPDFSVEP